MPSYFMAKNPERQDLPDFLEELAEVSSDLVVFSVTVVFTVSTSADLVADLAADFSAAVLVDLALLDLFDDFDFLVAIIPP